MANIIIITTIKGYSAYFNLLFANNAQPRQPILHLCEIHLKQKLRWRRRTTVFQFLCNDCNLKNSKLGSSVTSYDLFLTDKCLEIYLSWDSSVTVLHRKPGCFRILHCVSVWKSFSWRGLENSQDQKLWSSWKRTPAQSTGSSEVKSVNSGLFPDRSWKPPRLEMAWMLQAARCNTWLPSQGRFLPISCWTSPVWMHLWSLSLPTPWRNQLTLLDNFLVDVEKLLLSSLEAVLSPSWTISAPSAWSSAPATHRLGGHPLELCQLISVLCCGAKNTCSILGRRHQGALSLCTKPVILPEKSIRLFRHGLIMVSHAAAPNVCFSFLCLEICSEKTCPEISPWTKGWVSYRFPDTPTDVF